MQPRKQRRHFLSLARKSTPKARMKGQAPLVTSLPPLAVGRHIRINIDSATKDGHHHEQGCHPISRSTEQHAWPGNEPLRPRLEHAIFSKPPRAELVSFDLYASSFLTDLTPGMNPRSILPRCARLAVRWRSFVPILTHISAAIDSPSPTVRLSRNATMTHDSRLMPETKVSWTVRMR